MNRFFKTVALMILPLAVAACGDEQSDSGAGQHGGGAENSGGDNSGGGNNSGGNNSGGQESVELAGNWTVELNYTTTCEWGWNYSETVDMSLIYSMSIEEVSGGLEAQIASNYYMAGSGDADSMVLTGTFPMEGYDEQGSSSRSDENSISFRSEGAVESDYAEGTVAGSFITGFGADCTVDSGRFYLYR
jgi:hypothetical protein